MRTYDTSKADVHKVRPVVKAALKANREGLAQANARDRQGLDQPQVRKLAQRGLRPVK